jgi:hypothetical protein
VIFLLEVSAEMSQRVSLFRRLFTCPSNPEVSTISDQSDENLESASFSGKAKFRAKKRRSKADLFRSAANLSNADEFQAAANRLSASENQLTGLETEVIEFGHCEYSQSNIHSIGTL